MELFIPFQPRKPGASLMIEPFTARIPQADVDGPPIHALIPAGRGMPPKTRVVLDHLAEFFKRPL